MIADDREVSGPVVLAQSARRAGEHHGLGPSGRKQTDRVRRRECVEPFVRVEPPDKDPRERSADPCGRDASVMALRMRRGVSRDARVRGRLTRCKGVREVRKTRSENKTQPRRTEPFEKERRSLVESDH